MEIDIPVPRFIAVVNKHYTRWKSFEFGLLSVTVSVTDKFSPARLTFSKGKIYWDLEKLPFFPIYNLKKQLLLSKNVFLEFLKFEFFGIIIELNHHLLYLFFSPARAVCSITSLPSVPCNYCFRKWVLESWISVDDNGLQTLLTGWLFQKRGISNCSEAVQKAIHIPSSDRGYEHYLKI